MAEVLYKTSEDNKARFVLGEVNENGNTIYCIGVNPSTATPQEPDNTIKSVKRISAYNGFDGWVMLNLYPQRAKDINELPNEMDKLLAEKNFDAIKETLQKGCTVWLAFGDKICERPYLLGCLKRIYEDMKDLNTQWKSVEIITNKGNPHHPLYVPAKTRLVDFDLKKYLEKREQL